MHRLSVNNVTCWVLVRVGADSSRSEMLPALPVLSYRGRTLWRAPVQNALCLVVPGIRFFIKSQDIPSFLRTN